jgi:hypothetical protein
LKKINENNTCPAAARIDYKTAGDGITVVCDFI